MTDKDIWGPVHGPDEPCLTADRKPIVIGMAIVDYNRRQSVVTEKPWAFGRMPYDPVCWSQAGHQGHWWGTRTGDFDGSRMTTHGANPDIT